MSVVYIALPVALLLAIAGVIAFIWSVRSGQMDDLETPGIHALFDDHTEPPKPPKTELDANSPIGRGAPESTEES